MIPNYLALVKLMANFVFRKSVTNDIYSEYYENRKKTHLNCNDKIGWRGFLFQGCLMSDNRIANVGQKQISQNLLKKNSTKLPRLFIVAGCISFEW